MQPSSLLGILLDFIDEYESGDLPADVRLGKFFKKRRYLGSKDRRFVGDGAFTWLRHRIRGETRWHLWADRAGLSPPESGRTRHVGTILALAADGLFPWNRDEVVKASRSFAAATGGGWVEALDRSSDLTDSAGWPEDANARLAAECSLPEWVTARLTALFGEERTRRLGLALLEPPPVDLRVNLRIVEREVARVELEKLLDVEIATTPLSPAGLRLPARRDLKQFMKRHPGWVEVQDEGSQLVSLLLASLALASAREQTVPDGDSEDDGASARTIVDACAGGGGKTLAVADALSGEGKFHACDIDAAKLSDLLTRADPLGLRSLTVHGVSPQGELPRTLPRRADLVFTDVPCSGFGALRRNPDAKARYDEEAIAEFAQRQQGILERFAPTVRPGGYLAYVTCSILPHENENVVRRFLERFDDFEPATPPVIDRLPEDVVTPKGWIRLDPVTTATDGFFVACLRRIAPGD